MSEFFEPPPPPSVEPEPEFRQPPWFGPPPGTLPGVVALELVLARTDQVAVCVSRLAAYPTGFEFELVTMSADPMMFGHHRHRAARRGSEKELPPELLRIGVQFADGAKATNIAGFHHGEEPPAGPVSTPAGEAVEEPAGSRPSGCGRSHRPDR